MGLEAIPQIEATRLGEAETLRTLDRACREWGFFQLTGHGIPERDTEALDREMRAFFTLPGPVKQAASRSGESPWGYFDRELTKNSRDRKEVFDWCPALAGSAEDRVPDAAPGLGRALARFTAGCERAAFELLAAIARNLGVPAERLSSGFAPSHTSFLRLNYYPAETSDGAVGEFGVHRHTDSGALTLLLQDDQAGLEVLREGDWHVVEPVRGSLVVNIGDIVQVWSNDLYIAAPHRVRASGARARFSAPYFFNPAYETTYAPLCDADAAHYRSIQWGEFRSLRAAGDYADYGDEVQIDHYRIPRGD